MQKEGKEKGEIGDGRKIRKKGRHGKGRLEGRCDLTECNVREVSLKLAE